MELEHSFTVPVAPEQAWQVLLDVERVAPCMPGATVDSVDGDVVKGRIKVKVGPVTLTYSGTARFIERDDDALSITLEASGKETRGSGTASAKVRSTLRNENGQTQVVVYTTLSVTGRPAQFGRGVMAEVSGKIIQQFATNLAAQLGGDKAGAGQASGNGAPPGADAPGGARPASPDGGQAAATSPAQTTGAPADTSSPGQAGSADAVAGAGDVLAHSIEDLHLPVRAFNSLRRAGIHTLGDLSARSEDELLGIENLGPQSVREIKHKLAERGTQLSPAVATATASTTTDATSADADASSADADAANASAQAGAAAPAHAARHAGPSAATAAPRTGRPADQDVIDLLEVAGVPVLKRALPVVGALAAVLFLLLRRRRGRHRRRGGI